MNNRPDQTWPGIWTGSAATSTASDRSPGGVQKEERQKRRGRRSSDRDGREEQGKDATGRKSRIWSEQKVDERNKGERELKDSRGGTEDPLRFPPQRISERFQEIIQSFLKLKLNQALK